jgi:excisionase family DNA binding protein
VSGPQKFYSPKELAQMLGVSEWTIREWFKTGVLKGAKHGRQWRMSTEELTKYLEEKHG